MPTYGLTDAGFNSKPLDEIKAELTAGVQAALGLPPETPIGPVLESLVGVLAERYEEQWDLSEVLYQALDPDQATGALLDTLCAITGTIRRQAKPSTGTITVYGDAGTVLDVGRVVSVQGTNARFVTTESATIDTLTSGGESVPAGVTAGVHYRATVAVESEDTGPIAAPAGKLTQIETPVAGWIAAWNAEDAVLGQHVEGDEDLRVRREAGLRRLGSGSTEAIRARLLDLDGVTAAVIFENDTPTVNPDGLPPHSIEALVAGGDPDEIAPVIWSNKGGGIYTHGSVTETITDSTGASRTVRFSRPEDVPVYVTLTVTAGSGAPSESDVKSVIVATGSKLELGDGVFASKLSAAIVSMSGVLDVPSITVGTAPAPVGSSVSISPRQVATFDATNITVTFG